MEGECFALPITSTAAAAAALSSSGHAGKGLTLVQATLPPSKSSIARTKTEAESLKCAVRQLLYELDPPLRAAASEREEETMLSSVPSSWERHGDLVVLPSRAFVGEKWEQILEQLPDFWTTVAKALRCERLARDSEILSDKFRSSGAIMLRGVNPWVEHVDNGIKYVFDVTSSMFSSGNIAEKLRIAEFDCRGETVVDMYAGIGYFTLPYLVHARADTVHACEWSSVAVEGMRRGLATNRVEERCVVHEGDCREVSLSSNHQSLGLLYVYISQAKKLGGGGGGEYIF